jgi:N-acetylglucosaminyldiphosphoundecaprenol N-acetyl-beta-D-mannosaminyltransferase
MFTCIADFFDLRIHALTVNQLTGLAVEGVSGGKKWLIANHNLHSVYLLHRESRFGPDQKMHSYFNRAKCTHVDGMSIVLLARLFGHKLSRDHRVSYTEWLPYLMRSATENNWRVYYLGSTPGVVERGAKRLRERYAGLALRAHHGYFDISNQQENNRILADIASFKPDLLMVGMGMPRQERWIEENFDQLDSKIIVASGAMLDRVAGVARTPARWIGRLGFEWIYRFGSEPRRLAFRYLIEPWCVLFWLAESLLKVPNEDKESALPQALIPFDHEEAARDAE